MKVRILEKQEEKKWEEFVLNHNFGTIHQSIKWANFQTSIASRGEYWIIVLEEDNKIIGGTLLIRHKLPKRYCWLYASRGPLLSFPTGKSEARSLSLSFSTGKSEALLPIGNPEKSLHSQISLLLKKAKELAKKEKAIFLRIDPPLLKHSISDNLHPSCHCSRKDENPSPCHCSEKDENPSPCHCSEKDENPSPCHSQRERAKLCSRLGIQIPPPDIPHPFPSFHCTPYGFHPEHTLIINLQNSEEEILKQMKQKGRYNIRLAEKKDIEITKTDPKNKDELNQNLDDFYDLLKQTTERDKFNAHEKNYYKKMLENLKENSALYLAKKGEKTVAGIIITFFKDTAIYYYGASSNEDRNLMAPYLLQWHAIKQAKKQGYKYYDFFGIAPEDSKNHAWAGVTQFKKKFGGQAISYIPAQEYPFKKLLYLLYKLYKRIKK